MSYEAFHVVTYVLVYAARVVLWESSGDRIKGKRNGQKKMSQKERTRTEAVSKM